ncbi:hypothetical protein EMEDMD4_200011 [Sinorhizobium medicae]|uniref:Uncharacterized protein n=1 Tax=Sinorhizobium medicae TaxID=110321 RepID=A0A508WTX4_9HYPH|nr:hypothetical protein EMEDMD4_200011 [Sinorhizobium medicae]
MFLRSIRPDNIVIYRHSPGWITRKPSAPASQAFGNVLVPLPRWPQTGANSRVQNCGCCGRSSSRRHSPGATTRKPSARAMHEFGKVCLLGPRWPQTGENSRVQTCSSGGREAGRHSPRWTMRKPSARAWQALGKVRVRLPRSPQTGANSIVHICGPGGRIGPGPGRSSTTTVQAERNPAASTKRAADFMIKRFKGNTALSFERHLVGLSGVRKPILPSAHLACFRPCVNSREMRILHIPPIGAGIPPALSIGRGARASFDAGLLNDTMLMGR